MSSGNNSKVVPSMLNPDDFKNDEEAKIPLTGKGADQQDNDTPEKSIAEYETGKQINNIGDGLEQENLLSTKNQEPQPKKPFVKKEVVSRQFVLDKQLNIIGKTLEASELERVIKQGQETDTFVPPSVGDGIEMLNIESENAFIAQQLKESEERTYRMKTDVPDLDTFLIEEFSDSGMRNLYGDDKKVPDFCHNPDVLNQAKKEYENRDKQYLTLEEEQIKLTNCQVTCHFYNNNTYYVLVGYERGYRFNDGTYAQGRSILRVYKKGPEKDDLPDQLILSQILNDHSFDYANYKNYNPILKHGLTLYFYKIKNDKKTNLINLELWKYALDRETLERVKNGKNNYVNKKSDLFAAHVSFITMYPSLQVGPNALIEQQKAMLYLRTWPKSDQDSKEKTTEQFERNQLIQIAMNGEDWKPQDSISSGGENYEIQERFKERDHPQNAHLWIEKDDTLIDINPVNENTQRYQDQKIYKLSKPFYTYQLDNGFYKKEKMTLKYKEEDFEKFIDIFNIDDEDQNQKTIDEEESEDENIENKELQSMCIINDMFDLQVFYVYGSSVEYKRYVNQRYRPMAHFDKKKLHYFSRFAVKHHTGMVHDTYKNVFVNQIMHDHVDNRKSLKMIQEHPEDKDKEQGQKAPTFHYDQKAYAVVNQEITDYETKNKKKVKDKDKKKSEHWLKCSDENHAIVEKDKYFVYDKIKFKNSYEDVKQYDVARVENKSDNPFIRFRIIGGRKNGLNIQFSTYEDDIHICDFKVMTYFSQRKYRCSGLSWSSSMYYLPQSLKEHHWIQQPGDNEETQKICQNLQWAQMSDDGIFCRIVEYEISWPQDLRKYLDGEKMGKEIYTIGEKTKKPEDSPFQINMIGMKVILFNGKYETSVNNKNWFYPMYDTVTDEIIGTQWLPDTAKIGEENEINGVFYQLKNYSDKDYQYETAMVRSCLYNYYSNKVNNDRLGYIVIESQVADALDENYHKFTQQEVQEILNAEIRCLLNMKKTTYNDVFGINIKIDNYDFLQSMEVLGRQSIADFFLLDPEQIQIFCSKVNRRQVYENLSVIEDFLISKGNLLKHKQFFKAYGLYRGQGEISFDRNHSNTLFRCFDNGYFLEKLRGDQRKTFLDQKKLDKLKEEEGMDFKEKAQKRWSEFWNPSKDEDENQQMKQKAVFQMSGNHLLNYVLTKKPSASENRFIFFLLDILIEEGIEIERYFQNEMQYGVFNLDENSQSFSTLVQMDSLPASSPDIFSIRTLGDKFNDQNSFDFTDDKKFLKRYFTNYYNSCRDNDLIKVELHTKHRTEASKVFFANPHYCNGKMDNIQHRVQNFMIDRSCINLDCKKIQLLHLNTDDKSPEYLDIQDQEQWDLYELSQFLNRVQQTYGKNIDEHLVLMKLTDALFEGSRNFYYKQIMWYFMYLLPFLYQFIVLDHISDDKEKNWYNKDQEPQIILCNLICMVIAFGFFVIEIIQARVLGFREYLADNRSYEIGWFSFQVLYFLMKVSYPNQSFPLIDYVDSAELNNHTQSAKVMIIFSFLNSVLLVLIGLKLFYFLTVLSSFGTMIQLIYQTFNQINLFLIFYFFMLFVFSCIMIALGYDMNQSTTVLTAERRVYNENSIAQYFIANFLNSVGQINGPSVPVWASLATGSTDMNGIKIEKQWHAQLMIVAVWIFFVIVVIFLFIILANFLIAYISQSYEDVLENKVRNIYTQRCTLNDEYYLFRRWISLKFSNRKGFEDYKLEIFNIFLLTADFNTDSNDKSGDHGNIGVIKKVQNILVNHKEEIAYDVKKNRIEMERVRDEMAIYRREMVDLIQEIQETKENITGMVKSNLSNNNWVLYDTLWPDVKKQKDAQRFKNTPSYNKTKVDNQEKGEFEPLQLAIDDDDQK